MALIIDAKNWFGKVRKGKIVRQIMPEFDSEVQYQNRKAALILNTARPFPAEDLRCAGLPVLQKLHSPSLHCHLPYPKWHE